MRPAVKINKKKLQSELAKICMTQKELAYLIGMNKVSLCRALSRGRISPKNLRKISEQLHLAPEYLLDTLPSAQPEQHLCRECKWAKYYGNVDKRGNVEFYWHCMNWNGGTDEEGYCYEWENRCNQPTGGD